MAAAASNFEAALLARRVAHLEGLVSSLQEEKATASTRTERYRVERDTLRSTVAQLSAAQQRERTADRAPADGRELTLALRPEASASFEARLLRDRLAAVTAERDVALRERRSLRSSTSVQSSSEEWAVRLVEAERDELAASLMAARDELFALRRAHDAAIQRLTEQSALLTRATSLGGVEAYAAKEQQLRAPLERERTEPAAPPVREKRERTQPAAPERELPEQAEPAESEQTPAPSPPPPAPTPLPSSRRRPAAEGMRSPSPRLPSPSPSPPPPAPRFVRLSNPSPPRPHSPPLSLDDAAAAVVAARSAASPVQSTPPSRTRPPWVSSSTVESETRRMPVRLADSRRAFT